jgi:hypothetical protein
MTKPGKQREGKLNQLWCECDCANCEIGAHERCQSPKCHAEMERFEKQATEALVQVLLGKLPELELEFFRRVNSLLHQ